MAESPHADRRDWRLLLLAIPVAAAAAHGLLGRSRPDLTPLARWPGLAPAASVAVGAAVVLVLWLLLAAAPLARKAAWREALIISAPASSPFLLLFLLLVPGVERAGSGVLPMLVGCAWVLWALNAAAIVAWGRRGRLAEADLAPPERRRDRWARFRSGLDALLPFVLAAAAVRLHLADWRLGLGTLDQRTLAYAAERVGEGQVLYRDVFAPMPPGPVYLAAGLLQIGAPTLLLVKGLQVAAAVLLALAVYAAARQFTTPLFAVPAALFAAAAGPPSLALGLALFAVVCAFRTQWSREAAWSLAGLLTGLATLFDPVTGALTAVALLIVIALRQVRIVRARMTAPGVDMGLGLASAMRFLFVALVPVAVTAAYFTWARALPDLLRGSVTAHYSTLKLWLPHYWWGLHHPEGVRLETADWSGLMATAAAATALLVPAAFVLGLVRLAHGFARRGWSESDAALLAALLLGILLLVVETGTGGALAAAPALLVAAHLLAWAWQGVLRVLGGESRRLALVRLDGYALAGLAVVVLVAGMMAPALGRAQEEYARSRTPEQEGRTAAGVRRAAGLTLPDEEAAALEQTLEVIARRTPALEPILCLPDCPEIYFLADRDSPTRFIVARGFTMPADDMEMADALTEGKPPVVIVPSATGRESGKKKWPETAARIWRGYRLHGRFGRYEVWTR